jgi:Tol biopolymer transport system component/DNA-binding winged helix-turn-helix (wHTH) protein
LNAPDNPIYQFGPFLLEPHARRLSRHDEPVPLAAPEFELLLILVRNGGRVVEKNEIMTAVWPGVEVEENNLTVRMSALRRALGESKGYHPYIQTVAGRGYCLIAEVKEVLLQPITETAEIVRYEEPSVSSRSDVAPLIVPHRKLKIRRFTLYAVFALGLLTSLFLLYVVRSRKASDGEAPAQSMKISRVTQSGRVSGAALSPDGQNIAYAENEGGLSSLWLQRAGTNNPLQLLPPAKLYYQFPSFSPDGNTLYYSKCQPDCELHKMPILGGVETALGIRTDCRVTFSPDGKRMAYVRSDVEPSGLVTARLFVANADGTGEEFLNWESGGSVYQRGAPAWSPDGTVIAFSIIANEGGGRRMKVIGVSVADRTVSTLLSPSWNNIRDVTWVPDGSALIINGLDEASEVEPRMQVWRVTLAGSEARRITNDMNNYFSISLSADGSALIALQWESTSGLWIAPAENPSAAAPVTAGTFDRRDGHSGVSVAPDGRLIYVSDHSGKNDLWSVNADGTGLRQLTDATHQDHSPIVSPDGRYIVFQSCRNANSRAYNIWRVDADGRNPMQLTRGTYDSEPAFSPDGESVVYVAQENNVPKLRRVPIGGGEPAPLTDEFSQHPAFSPDGKVLVYYRMNQKQRDQRHFVFIPVQGGAPLKTLPAPKNFGAVMHWAPTGDSLLYRDSTLTSIWVLPLEGTPPSPILKLRNQTLSTFRFSPDGRQLAYSSGPQLRDVVLITRFN